MLCIYCKEREADAREHYLPQCLGRFQNFEPLLDRICQQCNQELGAEIEREFARQSPEAIARSINWIKGQRRGGQHKRVPVSVYQPERIGAEHLYLFASDPETGHTILWQTDKQPGTIKELSQFVVLDADEKPIKHIPVPAAITSGRDLFELFKEHSVTFPIYKVLVIASSGDEERIERMLSEWNVTCPMQRRKGGKISAPQIFRGKLGPAYFRTLAKIGFHYALKYIPTITSNEGAFRPLREFIRRGIGDAGQFLSSCDTVSNPNGPPGHVLTAVARTHADIVVNMQFFAGCKVALPQWRLILGPNPTTLFVNQVSAHFFAYSEDGDGRLKGEQVVTLNATLQ
jgi:hypothetical protein